MQPGLTFVILIILHISAPGIGEIYFEENFDDASWFTRWTMSQHVGDGIKFGKFEFTAGQFFANASNKGIRTTEDGRFYALSTRFPEFTNENKTLVLQYSVKNEQNISNERCLGGYIELFDCSFKPIVLNLETPYLLKFGPETCGCDDVPNQLGITFQHNGETYPINKLIPWEIDVYTQMYTLVMKVNGSYQIQADGFIVHDGKVQDDFNFPPEQMNDSSLYQFSHVCGVGFNFWQSDAGTIFDNILVSDDVALAEERRRAVLRGKITEQKVKEWRDNKDSDLSSLLFERYLAEEKRREYEKQRAEEERKVQDEKMNAVEANKIPEVDAETKARENQQRQDELNEKLMRTIYIATSLTLLAVSVGIVSAYIGCRSRTKYLVSKKEMNNFIKGLKPAPDDIHENNGILIASGHAENLPYNKKEFEIAPSLFKIDSTRRLGSGEFGVVCCGFIQRGSIHVQVAVKMMKECNKNLHAAKGLISEIKILAYAGEHENIVKLEGAYTAKLRLGKLFVFLEFCELGSLDKYLRAYNLLQKQQEKKDFLIYYNMHSEDIEMERVNPELTSEMFNDLQKWPVEIASGMAFLASKQIVHADLATRNVLLNAKKCAKIADFGLSRRLYNYTQYVKTTVEPLPWRWMAPESLKKNIFNEKTDVWAFGVTLWEMFTIGDQPFPGLSWDVNFATSLERGLRLPEPQYSQGNVYDVMKRCWEICANDRPSFSELKTILNTKVK